jgi:hypothetical protein
MTAEILVWNLLTDNLQNGEFTSKESTSFSIWDCNGSGCDGGITGCGAAGVPSPPPNPNGVDAVFSNVIWIVLALCMNHVMDEDLHTA